MQRRHKTVIIYWVGLLLFVSLAPILPIDLALAQTATFICAQDLNNDGDVAQQGETASCVTTPQGQLCPISAATCAITPACPLGAQYACSNGNCTSSGVCSPAPDITKYQCDLTGTIYDTQASCSAACTQTASCTNTYTCPLGAQYACMDNNSVYQCSPNTCVDQSTTTPVTTTPDLSSYTNNGTVDPSTGECLGQVYIFGGKGGQCRPSGVDTSFFNCCSTGAGGILDFLKYCKQSESDTDNAVDAHRCHNIGSYCVTKWPLVGCVQRASVYCCFNSQLGRIIQEQGRPQLQVFAPDGQWGTTSAPNCVGFTPEQFSMLDFSRMDLSEFFATIQQTMSSQVQNTMINNVNTFYQNTLH